MKIYLLSAVSFLFFVALFIEIITVANGASHVNTNFFKEKSTSLSRKRRVIIKKGLWPNGIIPYKMDQEHRLHKNVRDAMQAWESSTCIKFIPNNNNNEQNYLHVKFIGGKGL